MIRYLFFFILLLHGLIHLLGFVKGFGISEVSQLTQPISRTAGVFWLTAALFFITTAITFLLGKEWWWIIAIPAVILSQILIVTTWQDAKFGTLANVIALLVVVLSVGIVLFERSFLNDANEHLNRTTSIPEEILTEADLLPLPDAVQRYLRSVGVVNKPKVRNMRVQFEGEMRSKGKEFFPFTSVQYNCFDEPTRMFFMKGKMFGMTVPGYHKYARGIATMDIRLFGIYSIVKQSGEVLNRTEMVTLFNDMCLLAPATLIDTRIQWVEMDSTRVKATFTNQGMTITAELIFDEQGRLVNFFSNDRTETNDMKRYPFSTPISNYKMLNGISVMTYGEAVYEYPDGKFTYGKFHLKNIEYNCR